MRKILMAVAVVTSIGVCTGAFASDFNAPNSPKTTAYLNFGFGGHGKNNDMLSSLHYGLRMDQSNPYSAQITGQPARPAFMQADFNLRDGFSSALVNGVPFASHVKKFDEDGGETSYSMLDWGLLAIGAAGLGFGIAEVLKTKDDSDPATTGGGGNPATGLCGIVNGIPVLGPIVGGVLQCPSTGSSLANNASSGNEKSDYERINWLDKGMGQMGDLVTVR
ncbi:hypothetical protein [Stenotrophobium rhamnosiphilum]|uniref:DUF637 domain-containing protein n=1 Tax=Stenotrophobium rhamnosiphilum TaxID=2029166 RepID=A0A2T5MIB4_9GAMM|nr:hypothetical protein [Stenotrophobium rhamnosiphilum]PTU32326.1 hypothetical protein CJD38_06665 [Stenotrophobium rhamnosiphilum]